MFHENTSILLSEDVNDLNACLNYTNVFTNANDVVKFIKKTTYYYRLTFEITK